MAYNFGDRWLQRAQDSGGPGTIYCHASFSPNRSRRSLSQPAWAGDSRGVHLILSPPRRYEHEDVHEVDWEKC